MNREFKDALEDSPVIAAIKDDNGLKECLKSDIQVVFILYGDICNIADIVDTVKQAGKMALVHLDLINGLSAKDVAVDFIKKYTKADGIISTKPALIKHAGEIGLTSVLRLFVIRQALRRSGLKSRILHSTEFLQVHLCGQERRQPSFRTEHLKKCSLMQESVRWILV